MPMITDILINSSIGEVRLALLEQRSKVFDKSVTEIRLFRDHKPSYVGAVYLGRVTKLSREFQAAFVELENGLIGFLPLKMLPKKIGRKPKDLTELLCEGDKIIVQVTADAAEGKSPKLTGRIELKSTSIILHPFREGAYVSSKLKDPERRHELKQLGDALELEHIGLTFRTEAEFIDNEQLLETIHHLIDHWSDVIEAVGSNPKCGCISQHPEAVSQIMREYAHYGLETIQIDDIKAVKKAQDWAKIFAPNLLDKIEHYKGKETLFASCGAEDELENIRNARVSLDSGAWLTIEETEAFTAIDVNMGDALFSDDQELQILSVNKEAAREIFRQVRLRGIGGIIVVDFINMQGKSQISSFLAVIDNLMQADPMQIQRSNLSSFGLLEFARKGTFISLTGDLLKKKDLEWNAAAETLSSMRDAAAQAAFNVGRPSKLDLSANAARWLNLKQPQLMAEYELRTGSKLEINVK
jgi:ribonuclease G